MISTKTRVAVLRGGPSLGYDHSLKTGNYILSLLREMPEKYEPLDVFISRDGLWHYQGLAEDPHKILLRTDAVWNAMHGDFGEDGGVHQILESLKIPYAGSGASASIISLNKEMAKKVYKRHGLETPHYAVVSAEDFSEDKLIPVFREFFQPVIVKPANGIRALGVRLAGTFHDLVDAIKKNFEHSPKVIIEQYVGGSISTCLVVENGRSESLYSFVPTGRRSVEENRKIGEMAKLAHTTLGLRHYSSSDFIVTPRGKIYILETNAQPVMHEDSFIHQSLKSTGWRPRDFADHCLKLALKRS